MNPLAGLWVHHQVLDAAMLLLSGRSSRTPGEPDDKVYSTLREIEDAGHKVRCGRVSCPRAPQNCISFNSMTNTVTCHSLLLCRSQTSQSTPQLT